MDSAWNDSKNESMGQLGFFDITNRYAELDAKKALPKECKS